MMKNIFILFICLLVFSIRSNAQVKKVYAYKQASIPGILPDYSDETDIKDEKAKEVKIDFDNFEGRLVILPRFLMERRGRERGGR